MLRIKYRPATVRTWSSQTSLWLSGKHQQLKVASLNLYSITISKINTLGFKSPHFKKQTEREFYSNCGNFTFSDPSQQRKMVPNHTFVKQLLTAAAGNQPLRKRTPHMSARVFHSQSCFRVFCPSVSSSSPSATSTLHLQSKLVSVQHHWSPLQDQLTGLQTLIQSAFELFVACLKTVCANNLPYRHVQENKCSGAVRFQSLSMEMH